MIVLIIGLFACRSNELEKVDLADHVSYPVFENDHTRMYGELKTIPNNGYRLTRVTKEILPSSGEPVNTVVTILGAYSNTDDHFCFVNQMIGGIKAYNRWGAELTLSDEDFMAIKSGYSFPEHFTAAIRDTSIIKD